ncbi:MAG: hypothetical protein OEV77_12410 [Nitrospira sp.]|nr:hypothetical protein [Nitrospira sp.]
MMIRRTGLALVSAILLSGLGCASHAPQQDIIQAQLAAPPDQVKQAVTQVLTNSGYAVAWKNDSTLNTGYREESGGWNSLYRCCWGVVKSRVEATVTPGADQTTQLSLHVMAEGKRTFFDGYAPIKTPYPESAENQLRLIKNKLKIVSHPYTTQTFFSLQ